VRELGELREFGRVNISRRSHGLAFGEAKLEKSCNKKPAEAGSLR
jgi:hypothetical protein